MGAGRRCHRPVCLCVTNVRKGLMAESCDVKPLSMRTSAHHKQLKERLDGGKLDEARIRELEEGSITDVQDVMWEELFNVRLVDKPFAATKELLASKEDWLTLEMLFDDGMLAQLGPVNKEDDIYEFLIKDLSDDPRGFMNHYFHYEPAYSDEEESGEEDDDDEDYD